MPGLGWLEIVVAGQTILPALMFVPGMLRFRMITRIMSFGLPMMAWAMFVVSGRRAPGRPYPPAPILALACGWVAISVAHPFVNTLTSALASVAMTTAVCCPAFWVPAKITDPRQLKRLVWLMLLCSGASTLVGVGQVYRPDTFNPPKLSVEDTQSAEYVESLKITLDDGRQIMRPPGLTDVPWGGAWGGSAALGLGLAMGLAPGRWWQRSLALGLATCGLFMLFFSQVRLMTITTLLGIVAWAGLLALRGEVRKLSMLLTCSAALGTLGVAWVMRDGGQAIMRRFQDLAQDNATKTFQKTRGGFIAHALTEELPAYPLGAGPGRVGMASAIFGNRMAPIDRRPLYAETQVEDWVYDGGLPLLILYPTAVLVAFAVVVRAALTNPDRELAYLAGALVIFGVTVAVSALGSHAFNTSLGIQFWCFFAAVHGAVERARLDAARAALRHGAAP